MENTTSYNKFLEALISMIEKKQNIPFYNEPIFLTLLAILLGGIALTLIVKHIEHKNKSREMALDFLNSTGLMLSSMQARINGHIKRKDYGKNMNKKTMRLKEKLLSERFNVRIKSKSYLKSNDFWKKYDLLVYEFDMLLYTMKNSQNSDSEKYIKMMDEGVKFLEQNWKTTNLQTNEHKSSYIKGIIEYEKNPRENKETNSLFHEKLVIWADMLWLRSNILIYDALNKLI